MNIKFITSEYVTAKEIKRIRNLLKLTQKEFAILINCSKSTIERWESSDEKITGPIVFLLRMLEQNPEYVEEIHIPEKTYPMRLGYMHQNTVCTIIDVDELRQRIRITNYVQNVLFRAFGREEKLLANQQVIKIPIVRNGKQATVGYMPDVWKGWS